MSLLGFFRRRQKMVMIIMVVLMVSFLIGFQGFNSIVEKNREDMELAKTSVGDLKLADRRQAGSDIRTLETIRNIAANIASQSPEAHNAPAMQGDAEFRVLTGDRATFGNNNAAEAANQQKNADLSYALLLKEATKKGARVSDGDVDAFFDRVGISGETYTSLKGIMRQRGIPEDQLRQTIRNWLMIQRYFAASIIDTPPSREELLYIYRDYLEQIKLQVLVFSADKYMDKVDANFAPDQIKTQLARYAQVPAGLEREDNPFGFGYLQLPRARILYMFLPQDVLERACKPSDANIRKYYNENKADFAAAGPTTTSPAQAKSLFEVRPQIIRMLASAAVQDKLSRLVPAIQAMIAKHPGPGKTAGTTYEWVRDQLLHREESNAALAKPVTIQIDQEPLGSAVERLAKVAGLEAIVFPQGESGGKKLDPSLQVKLTAKDMPLGEALAQLARQAAWSEIQWGMIDEFPGVLFPIAGPGGADFAPIVLGDTQTLFDQIAIQKDPILGRAFDPLTRQPLVQLAVATKPKLNTEGPVMEVFSQRSGQLLWRIADYAEHNVPQEATGEIRDQVIKDLRTQEAFRKAEEAARSVNSVKAFDERAQDANDKIEVVNTDYFSRVLIMQGRLPQGIDLPQLESIRNTFLETAFALAPQNVEPPYPPATTVGTFSVPAKRQALVMKRTGYKPLVQSEFDEKYGPGIFNERLRQTASASYSWFLARAIQARTGYQGPQASDE